MSNDDTKITSNTLKKYGVRPIPVNGTYQYRLSDGRLFKTVEEALRVARTDADTVSK